MVTALITGGTGFVGSWIARSLVEAGHTPRILRRPSSRLDLVKDLPVEHAIGDVLDHESLEQAMQGCTWVFHAAAVADYWRAQRIKMYLVNVHGTRAVLDAAHQMGVKRVVLTSSAAAVGPRRDNHPADETEPFNLPPNRFPYGHSKALSEQEAHRALARGQEVVIVNPSIVLGPGDVNQISGSNVVEFARGLVPPFYPVGSVTVIDVRDVARAHLAAAEHGRSGERYLLGQSDVSYKTFWEMIAQVVGARPPLLPLPAFAAPLLAFVVRAARRMGLNLPVDADQVWLSAQDIRFDCQKAWRELGKPQITLAQSIRDTYCWYIDHGIIPEPRRLETGN